MPIRLLPGRLGLRFRQVPIAVGGSDLPIGFGLTGLRLRDGPLAGLLHRGLRQGHAIRDGHRSLGPSSFPDTVPVLERQPPLFAAPLRRRDMPTRFRHFQSRGKRLPNSFGATFPAMNPESQKSLPSDVLRMLIPRDQRVGRGLKKALASPVFAELFNPDADHEVQMESFLVEIDMHFQQLITGKVRGQEVHGAIEKIEDTAQVPLLQPRTPQPPLVDGQHPFTQRAETGVFPWVDKSALADLPRLLVAPLARAGVDLLLQVRPGRLGDPLVQLVDPVRPSDLLPVEMGQVRADMGEIPPAPVPVHLPAFQITREQRLEPEDNRGLIKPLDTIGLVKMGVDGHDQVPGRFR